MQTLHEGSTGQDVVEWQHAIGVTPADGVFGPITANATKQWQSQNGLTADGVVGPQSWSAAGIGTGTRVSESGAALKPVTKLSLPTSGVGKVTNLTASTNWLGVPRSVWMLGAVGGLFVGFHFHSKKLAR